MPPCVASHVDHQGKTFIVGHAGQLYAPRTFIDAWGRIRHTQKATKYRIVTCGCGQTFVAHDGDVSPNRRNFRATSSYS